MLNKTPSDPKGPQLRLCSICDGIDAVMLFTAYFAQFPSAVSRRDLSMSEALEHLQRDRDLRFDRIILVPNAAKPAVPRLLQALIEEASRHSSDVVVLLPKGARVPIPGKGTTGLKVLYGPPFQDTDVPAADLSAEAKAGEGGVKPVEGRPTGFLRKLLSGGRAKTTPDRDEPPITAAPRSRELPEQIHTIMVLPVSGGVGSTTCAVNLAAEAARANPRGEVCLIDLNLQYGNVGTYTALPVSSQVLDAYRGIDTLDSEAFEMCLQQAAPNLTVFAGPGEVLPLDGIGAKHLTRLVQLARKKADLVIVDLPHQIADWSEAAFVQTSLLLAVGTLDVRTAQNLAKLNELMRGEHLPIEKLFFLLNRLPHRRTKSWQGNFNQFERSSPFGIFRQLPEGGDAVAMACNAGVPLWQHAPSNPFRVALRELAADLLAHAAPRVPTATEAR